MKAVYASVGVPTARYVVFSDHQELYDFIEKVGYPIVVKPDNGVGASSTYKLKDQATLDVAKEFANVHILQNKWENNYAKQFNWGLEHANITTQWVLRLDADEYLLPELVQELQEKLPSLPDDVTGIIFNRRHLFMDKWLKEQILKL